MSVLKGFEKERFTENDLSNCWKFLIQSLENINFQLSSEHTKNSLGSGESRTRSGTRFFARVRCGWRFFFLREGEMGREFHDFWFASGLHATNYISVLVELQFHQKPKEKTEILELVKPVLSVNQHLLNAAMNGETFVVHYCILLAFTSCETTVVASLSPYSLFLERLTLSCFYMLLFHSLECDVEFNIANSFNYQGTLHRMYVVRRHTRSAIVNLNPPSAALAPQSIVQLFKHEHYDTEHCGT